MTALSRHASYTRCTIEHAFTDSGYSLVVMMESCNGYLGHPFKNKQGKSCVELLARDVDKEEKIGVVVIISPLLENR
jgi:hypothetical protein